MRIKSYFTANVESAIEQAARDLGRDALLINSRPTTPETRHLGAYEVVFGVPPDNSSVEGERVASPASAAPGGDVSPSVASELARLREALSGVTRLLEDRSSAPRPQIELRPQIEPQIETTASAGFAPWLGKAGGTPAIAVFVGPAGGGKTTALAKLAVCEGIARRRSVAIVSCDVARVAAAEQLRTLSAILGVPFCVADSPSSLEFAVSEHRAKDLILVDTSGLDPENADDVIELGKPARPDCDVHLVLPASMQLEAMVYAGSYCSRAQPDKVLFTKLDEAASIEPALSAAQELQLPISYLSAGQAIPDAIEGASREAIDEWRRRKSLGEFKARPAAALKTLGANA